MFIIYPSMEDLDLVVGYFMFHRVAEYCYRTIQIGSYCFDLRCLLINYRLYM